MAGMFGSPSVPRPQPVQPAPQITDPAVQSAQAEALRAKQNAKGYRSTILRQMTGDIPKRQETFGT